MTDVDTRKLTMKLRNQGTPWGALVAAFFAVLFGGESLTTRMLIGGALVIGATYLVELRPGARDPAATALEDPPAEALHHEA